MFTKPSQITNQAKYIARRNELSMRMGKFERNNSTKPQFSDTLEEDRYLNQRLTKLSKG